MTACFMCPYIIPGGRLSLAIFLFTISPFLATAGLVYWLDTSAGARRTLFGASLLLTLGSAYVYLDTFVIHPDPGQDTLVFVALPVWQMEALVPVALVAVLLWMRSRTVGRRGRSAIG